MKKTYEQGICEGYAKAAEESAQRIAGLEADLARLQSSQSQVSDDKDGSIKWWAIKQHAQHKSIPDEHLGRYVRGIYEQELIDNALQSLPAHKEEK